MEDRPLTSSHLAVRVASPEDAAEEDPQLGELDTIAVDPSHWRQGVGRALTQVAEAALLEAGYCAAILWTTADYELGYRFYDAMGWQLDGATRHERRQVMLRRVLAVA